MQITFKDGSFISIDESTNNNEKLNIVICGKKGPREVTMSSLDLDKSEVESIVSFLDGWLQNNQ